MGRHSSIAVAMGALLTALVLSLFACSGEPSETGLAEPLRLRNGSFKEGDLPGEPPADTSATSPLVTSFETASTVIRPGQTEKGLLGRVSPDAVAIGIRFADLGSGYWVLPVDGPDPQNNGELVWQALADFGSNVPAGLHALRVVAIDGSGHAGAQRQLSVCVTPSVPDNLNACQPTNAPPSAVLSLSWDTAVDLDLVVVTPEGRVVDAKHPRSSAPGGDTGDAGAAVSVGTFDRDSNAACTVDGVQRENLVFPARPSPGSYLVYANLFEACGAASVHFRFSLFEASPTADPKVLEQVETITKSGTLLALEANGGARLGTFVTEVTF
jgi:hypothetical protein